MAPLYPQPADSSVTIVNNLVQEGPSPGQFLTGIWKPSVLSDLFTDQLELEFVDFRPSREFLEKKARESRGCVQFSRPMPVIAESAEEALSIICPRFLVDTARTSRSRPQDRAYLQRRLRNVYIKSGLKAQVAERVRVDTANFSGGYDFLVKNGRAVQLAQTWSFLVDPDHVVTKVKEWAWNLSDLRKSGGQVFWGDNEISVRSDVPVEVLYVEPESKPQASISKTFEEPNSPRLLRRRDQDPFFQLISSAHKLRRWPPSGW